MVYLSLDEAALARTIYSIAPELAVAGGEKDANLGEMRRIKT